jgi:hypothetical protein
VDEPEANINGINGFRESWGLDGTVQVLSRSDIIGGFSGLQNAGDAVHLYDDAGALVARVVFGDSEGGGSSFEWTTDDVSLGFSVAGENHAYVAFENGLGSAGTDVGSPAIAVAEASEPLLGDVNGDGLVNGLDVEPFVEVLLNGPYQVEADVNEDDEVNGLDVDPFVAIILGSGGAAAVPEPSTLALLAIGLGVFWVRCRR